MNPAIIPSQKFYRFPDDNGTCQNGHGRCQNRNGKSQNDNGQLIECDKSRDTFDDVEIVMDEVRIVTDNFPDDFCDLRSDGQSLESLITFCLPNVICQFLFTNWSEGHPTGCCRHEAEYMRGTIGYLVQANSLEGNIKGTEQELPPSSRLLSPWQVLGAQNFHMHHR
jgi:hypothetical protein